MTPWPKLFASEARVQRDGSRRIFLLLTGVFPSAVSEWNCLSIS